MPCGVMVARRILVPPVRVRILPGQQIRASLSRMNLKVSVIMVTYNQENYVDEAIRSVILQKFKYPYELIIGDDCSSDNTVARCRKWQKKYPEIIKIVERTSNLGIQRNYMDIYNRCKGEYIAICEGDDFWCSDKKLQTQVDYMDSVPECNVSFHKVVNYYTSDRTMSWSNGGQKKDTTIADLARSNYITNLSVMYRKGALSELPEWLADVNPPDYILHMLHADGGNIHYINKAMAVYRQHSNGIWAGGGVDRKMRMSLDTRLYLMKHFKDNYVVVDGLRIAYNPIALNLMLFYKSINDEKRFNELKKELFEVNPTWTEDILNKELKMRQSIMDRFDKFTIMKFMKGCRALISKFIPVPRIKTKINIES